MMKKTWIPVLLLLFVGAGTARAMLPPDASAREPQLRRERIEVDRKYDKYLEEQRAIAIQRHKDVMAGLDFPPWKRTAIGTPKPGASLSSRSKPIAEKVGHSWPIGLAGLLLMGALFWFIKRMTREVDSR